MGPVPCPYCAEWYAEGSVKKGNSTLNYVSYPFLASCRHHANKFTCWHASHASFHLENNTLNKKKTHIPLVYQLQIPAACTPHEHHLNSNYYDTQSPTLFQYTLPPSPPSRLILHSDEHLHSSYKTVGQLHMKRTIQLLAYNTVTPLYIWLHTCWHTEAECKDGFNNCNDFHHYL